MGGVAGESSGYGVVFDAVAVAVEEEGGFGGCALQEWTDGFGVAFEVAECGFAYRNNALFVAFAGDDHGVVQIVDVVGVEGDEFPHPDAG